MHKLARLIANGAVLFGGIALAIILALISAQIGMRLFFGDPLSWPDELARLFFTYLVFIGAAETSMRHAHISVDLQDTFGVSSEIDRVFDLIRMAFCIAVLCVIAWGAWLIIPVVENMQRPATRLSTAWMFYPVVIGSVLMAIATVINFVACLTRNDLYTGRGSGMPDELEKF